jgi:hypothetical protein
MVSMYGSGERGVGRGYGKPHYRSGRLGVGGAPTASTKPTARGTRVCSIEPITGQAARGRGTGGRSPSEAGRKSGEQEKGVREVERVETGREWELEEATRDWSGWSVHLGVGSEGLDEDMGDGAVDPNATVSEEHPPTRPNLFPDEDLAQRGPTGDQSFARPLGTRTISMDEKTEDRRRRLEKWREWEPGGTTGEQLGQPKEP